MGSWLGLGGGQPVLDSLVSLWCLSGIGSWDGCTPCLSHSGQEQPGGPSAGLPPSGLAVTGHHREARSPSPSAASLEHRHRGLPRRGWARSGLGFLPRLVQQEAMAKAKWNHPKCNLVQLPARHGLSPSHSPSQSQGRAGGTPEDAGKHRRPWRGPGHPLPSPGA